MAPALRFRRLPVPTARAKLTWLYLGMFLVLGTAVIIAILLFARTGSAIRVSAASPGPFGGRAAQSVVLDQKAADTNRVAAVSWLALAVTAVAAAGLGWLASGRVLRPLREMAATARTISAGNLHERLALKGPDDEIKQLGDTLDDLFGRLEASFEAQRRFVANASHELRTPLTVERALLQLALADPDASAATLRTTCEELLESGRDQERLLEALLTLASSERGLEQRSPVDLAELAGRAVRRATPAIDRRGLRLLSSLGPAPAEGDEALLERLIANLIDNAIAHNDDRGEVEVRTGTGAGGSWVTVSNTGPVIPAGEVERLFEPFERLGDGRAATGSEHFGLGLSIVRAIAAAHGASLSAEPLAGGGLAVTVRL